VLRNAMKQCIYSTEIEQGVPGARYFLLSPYGVVTFSNDANRILQQVQHNVRELMNTKKDIES